VCLWPASAISVTHLVAEDVCSLVPSAVPGTVGSWGKSLHVWVRGWGTSTKDLWFLSLPSFPSPSKAASGGKSQNVKRCQDSCFGPMAQSWESRMDPEWEQGLLLAGVSLGKRGWAEVTDLCRVGAGGISKPVNKKGGRCSVSAATQGK
jgi:hypothetical protein